MAKSVVIKDTYHSYIELDPLSAKLVDTPWLQRLKLVRQNDVSPFVYPTMQSTRFEHSLGAMHLSKKCMESALRQPDADRFLSGLWEEIQTVQPNCFAEKDLRELSVQLAGLVGLLHDVGHPPLSHLIENCVGFQELYPGVKAPQKLTQKWHEYNGLAIIEKYLCPLFSAENEPFSSACIHIAYLILAGQSDKPFLKSIHQLVDAVIDSDRMDFVLRDGGSSGSEFGRYDVNRIVQTFGFCFDDSSGKTEIYIRPSSKAQSAVESLLQERYKIYRWVHFHTRVLLGKAIFRYALKGVAESSIANAIAFDKVSFKYANYYNALDVRKGFVLLGDSYVWDVLSRAMLYVQARIPQLAEPLQSIHRRLLNALKCVILRERWGMALWKRMDEYDLVSSDLKTEFRDGVTAPPDVDKWTGPLLNWIGDYALSAPRILEPLQAALDESAKKFDCWTLIEPPRGLGMDHDDRIIVQQNGECRAIPLTRVSTVAKGLADAWKSDVHLYVFVFSDTEPWTERSDEGDVRESLTRAFVEAVVNIYKTVPSWQKQLTGFLKNRVIEKEAS